MSRAPGFGRVFTTILIGVAASCLIAGCAAMRGGDKPITLRLDPPLPAAAATLLPGPVTVSPVAARGLAGGTRYVYADAAAPAELRQAATLFWEEPPTLTLQRALVADLRRRFATVTGPDLPAAPNGRRVVARLSQFEERSAGGAAAAAVSFEVTLVGAPLQSGYYCARSTISGARPSDRAHAFEQALAAGVDRFVQDAATGQLSSRAC